MILNFVQKLLSEQTDTYTGPTALTGPLKWSIMGSVPKLHNLVMPDRTRWSDKSNRHKFQWQDGFQRAVAIRTAIFSRVTTSAIPGVAARCSIDWHNSGPNGTHVLRSGSYV